MGSAVMSGGGGVAGDVVLVGCTVFHPMLRMLCEGYVGAGVGRDGLLVGIVG